MCSCSDHQAFACLCMRGRGRKLVAIQTEAHACQQQSLVVCLAGSASATLSAQPPKSECVRQRCKYKIASDISCDSARVQQQHDRYMTRARSAAVSLGGVSRPVLDLRQRASVWIATSFHQRPRMQACKRLVNTSYVPSQGADDDLRDRGAQADRVEPAHGVLPNPRALQVVYTKRPHDCDQPEHPPMTVCAHDIVGLGRVVAPT